MDSLTPEKRISFAFLASAVVHATLLAILVWRGGVFSRATLVSGPIDLLENAARAVPVTPAVTKPAVPAKSEHDVAVKTEASEPAESVPTTAAPTAAVPTETAVGSSDAGEMARYVGLLVAVVQKNRRYPKDAIDREEEGVVGLEVKLGSNGDLIEAAVKTPSPFTSLNQAALKTVQSIPHFPKPPIADGTTIELAIPMRFKIERL